MFANLRITYQRHSTLLGLFALFVTFRLLALLLFRPGGFIVDDSDYDFYYLWGQQIPQGFETFVNLWTAYPPLFPAIMLPIFEWSSRIPPWTEPRLFFHLLFGLVLLLFESGNFLLLYRLSSKLGYPSLDMQQAGALWARNRREPFGHATGGSPLDAQLITHHSLHPILLYTLLFTPVYTMLGWFECMPLFFMLLGLDLLLSERRGGWLGSAIAAALGFLTKLTPALLVPIAVRWLGSKLSWQALQEEWFNPHSPGNLLRPMIYALLFFAVVLGGGYWLVGGHTELALSSFQVNAIRPPWQSIWALIDGNYEWGLVPVNMRNLEGLQQTHWESNIPWGWVTLIFVLFYLWLYTRRYDWNNPRTPVVFAALSVIWLFLYSKGWSPQFLVWILAFIALLLPTTQGIALSISLSILSAIESPIFFNMLGNERWILASVIILRTLFLSALFVEFLGQIWPNRIYRQHVHRFAAVTTWLLILAIPIGTIGGLPRAAQAYTAQRLADHPCRDAISYLQTEAPWPTGGIVSTQIKIWQDFYPWLHQSYSFFVVDGYDPNDRPWETVLAERLDARVGNESFWWLLYHEQESHAATYFSQPSVYRMNEQRFGDCTLTHVKRIGDSSLAVAAVDGGPIQLEGVDFGRGKVGEALHVVLYWQAIAPVNASYTVFVHLRNALGEVITQQDNLPVEGLAPTNTWQSGVLIRDPYRLEIPAAVEAGTYQLHIGLYTADGRLPLTLADGTQTDHWARDIEMTR